MTKEVTNIDTLVMNGLKTLVFKDNSDIKQVSYHKTYSSYKKKRNKILSKVIINKMMPPFKDMPHFQRRNSSI